jgi:hypothetical protein
VSEAPVPRTERPGRVQVVITSLLVVLFATKAVLWWYAVLTGTTAVADMTAWGWLKIGFYHVAVVAGVAAVIEMLRARAKPPGAEPVAAAEGGRGSGSS